MGGMRSLASFSRDERGGVSVEYVVLLLGVAVLCSAALVLSGSALVSMFYARQTLLLLPFP
jgi:Flp pilus assembly pilin Flp